MTQNDPLTSIALICPSCRDPRGASPSAWQLISEPDGASLYCPNPRCGARFPIVDGVPIVFADLASYFEQQGASALVPLEPDAATDLVLAQLPADDPLRVGRQALSSGAASALTSYLAAPPSILEDAPLSAASPSAAPSHGAALATWLDRWLPTDATRAVDLGCGVGAAALALAQRGLSVVAIDTLVTPLRLLRRLRDDGEARVPLRGVGSRYRSTSCRLPQRPPRERLLVLAADALQPPLPAQHFDVVFAGNVLDNVHAPWLLLGQADALLKPGGRLFVTSASSYRADITPEPEWLGASGRRGADAPSPEDALRDALRGRDPRLPHLAYRLLDDRPNLRWTVARDDRCAVTYAVHAVVAEKA